MERIGSRVTAGPPSGFYVENGCTDSDGFVVPYYVHYDVYIFGAQRRRTSDCPI